MNATCPRCGAVTLVSAQAVRFIGMTGGGTVNGAPQLAQ